MEVEAIEAHPWMANSNPGAVKHMLEIVGVGDVEELYEQIPADHRISRPLDLPAGLSSEADLSRHMSDTLGRNQGKSLTFLGGGCWPHYVPAVVDEVVSRTEFLTSIWGTPSSDLGRNQAWFEFCSQLGELLEMDFVGLPLYSYGCAAGHALRMATRLTGRTEVLVPRTLDPERAAVIRSYAGPVEMATHIDLVEVECDWTTGQIDLADLEAKLSDRTAAVYLENPTFLGNFEASGPEAARLARAAGAETVVGVDPISLGVVAPPAEWGADIVVGTMQPLGVHMNCGGGVGGFIATRDEERYAREYPTLCLSACGTTEPGELGFSMTLFEQSSYGSRELGNDWTGNSTYLWAIAGAVYMALMGPRGFEDIGRTILERSHYAAAQIGDIPGASVRFGDGFFKEFVVDFGESGKTVAEINRTLLDEGIFGCIDLSKSMPDLGQCGLFCVTEIHRREDIDQLTSALKGALS